MSSIDYINLLPDNNPIKNIANAFLKIEQICQEYLDKQTAQTVENRLSQLKNDKLIEPIAWTALPNDFKFKRSCITGKLISKKYSDGIELMYTRNYSIVLNIFVVTFELVDFKNKIIHRYEKSYPAY